MELDPANEWKRVLLTARKFGKKHGHWPTRIVLSDDVLDALSAAFTPDDWAFLGKEIEVRSGAARTRAEDAEGDSYISGESLATRLTFTVKEPEPAWFSLRLDTVEEGAPDELGRALRRLGYEPDEDDPDEVTSVERAVARAGSAAVMRIRDADPPEAPGNASSPLRELLKVRKVRDVLSAQEFRRIQMAILRVYASEFVAYYGFKAQQDEHAWGGMSRRAGELSEALTTKPLSESVLQSLTQLDADQDRDKSNFISLAGWAAALAVDERHLTADPETSG